MTVVRIYGAGMAGLLAAEMLRRMNPFVYEAQPVLPDNHGALLRFRSDAVARETGQPFRKVRVLKAVKSGGRLRSECSLADANRYAHKVTGSVAPRSVLDLSPCERYIAPPAFLGELTRNLNSPVHLGRPLTREALATFRGQRETAAISTIPMPALMAMVEWPKLAFDFRSITSVCVALDDPPVDVYQTIYYPGNEPYYRASITGNQLIVECMGESIPGLDLAEVLADFGLPGSYMVWVSTNMHTEKFQRYGKLLPIPEKERHEFIMAMTDEYNLYSVGRFATWRQLLLDDVVGDIRKVEAMITQRNAYRLRLGREG